MFFYGQKKMSVLDCSEAQNRLFYRQIVTFFVQDAFSTSLLAKFLMKNHEFILTNTLMSIPPTDKIFEQTWKKWFFK